MRSFFFAAGTLAGTTLAAALFLAASFGLRPAAAATPPPTPPPIGTPAAPAPAAGSFSLPAVTPSPAPATTTAPKPTPTPPRDARKGLNGVWEVAIQHATGTDYTHFALTQQGDALSGTYVDGRGKKFPLVGSLDCQAVRLIVTLPNGTTLLLEGKLDGTTDMVGILTSTDGQVPFTAAYRAKEKWIENVNPSPGGIPQPGGYTPP